MNTLFVKRNDKVMILQGKDRGKTGKVTQVMPDAQRVVVEGLNMVKRHQRARKQGQKGQMISKEQPIATSRVQVVCPKCGRATRIGHLVTGDKKTRVCKKCNAEI